MHTFHQRSEVRWISIFGVFRICAKEGRATPARMRSEGCPRLNRFGHGGLVFVCTDFLFISDGPGRTWGSPQDGLTRRGVSRREEPALMHPTRPVPSGEHVRMNSPVAIHSKLRLSWEWFGPVRVFASNPCAGSKPGARTTRCFEQMLTLCYRGTSLIKNSPAPERLPWGPRHSPTVGS